ncbi:hypothetical protein QQ045_020501 [Rhodiola kirilowii]
MNKPLLTPMGWVCLPVNAGNQLCTVRFKNYSLCLIRSLGNSISNCNAHPSASGAVLPPVIGRPAPLIEHADPAPRQLSHLHFLLHSQTHPIAKTKSYSTLSWDS